MIISLNLLLKFLHCWGISFVDSFVLLELEKLLLTSSMGNLKLFQRAISYLPLHKLWAYYFSCKVKYFIVAFKVICWTLYSKYFTDTLEQAHHYFLIVQGLYENFNLVGWIWFDDTKGVCIQYSILQTFKFFLLFYIECTFFIYFMHKCSTHLMFLFWINVFISPRQSIAFIDIIINVLVAMSFIFLNICIFLTFYPLIESFHFYCRNACNFILFLIIFKISLPSLVCFASF